MIVRGEGETKGNSEGGPFWLVFSENGRRGGGGAGEGVLKLQINIYFLEYILCQSRNSTRT